jgi:hypothetical protein
MPDGRSVEDVAALAPTDMVNAVMKVAAKEIRRATQRLCGWGGLDESELETIPRAERVVPREFVPVEYEGDGTRPPEEEPLVLARVRDDLAQRDHWTDAGLATVYLDHEREVTADVAEDVRNLLLAAMDGTASKPSVARLRKAIAEEKTRRAVPSARRVDVVTSPDAPATPAVDPVAQALADYTAARSRDEVDAITAEVAKLGLASDSAARARQLKARKAALARVAPQPPTDDGPRGGAPPPEATPADDPEAAAVRAEGNGELASGAHPTAGTEARLLAAITQMKGCHGPAHVASHVVAHAPELPLALVPRYYEVARAYLPARYPRAQAQVRDALAALDAAESEYEPVPVRVAS